MSRLRDFYRAYAQESRPVDTPFFDDGLTSAPDSTFQTPPPEIFDPPAQVYADGGSVESFPRTRGTYRALRDMAAEALDRTAGREWDYFKRDRYNPLMYGVNAADRAVKSLANNPQAALDFVDPGLRHKYGPMYAPVDVASVVANAIPGVNIGTRAVLGTAAGAGDPELWSLASDAARGLAADTREYLGFRKGGSAVADVWKKVRDKHGQFQADRLARAADEADLSRFSEKALMGAFDPVNSGLFITMPPHEFQDYATRIPQSSLDAVPYNRWKNVPGGKRYSRDDQTLDNYLDLLNKHMGSKGSADLPSLWLFKNLEGLTEIEGHEGRHRMMAMARKGDKRSLVHLTPANKGELRRPLDERWEYLFDKYTPMGADELIVPQFEIIDSPTGSIKGYDRHTGRQQNMEMINREPTPLSYEPFADGGSVLRRIARAVKGKPSTVKIAGETLDAAPIQEIEDIAAKFAADRGRNYPIDAYPEFDEDRARRIAQAYDTMKHDPHDPSVRRSYEALIDETLDQYRALDKLGLDFHFLRPGEADPYAKTPALGYRDLTDSGRLAMFPTEQGFGTLSDISDNPLLRRVGRVGDLDDATANDAFRVVHDVYGHYGPGNPFFRHKGEDRAWRAHSRLYSDDALPAATSELRGQNSWVNFGPYGEHNRRASGADTVYADQKIGRLPDWVWEDAPGYREGSVVKGVTKALKTRKAEALEKQALELNRGRTPGDTYLSPPVDPKLQTVDDPVRVTYPLIYSDPRDIVSKAREVYAPDLGKESAMYQLFGHTRDSLDELARSNKAFDLPRPSSPEWAAYIQPGGFQGNENVGRVMNRRNANRIVDVLGEGLEDPTLRTMRSWYEMSPLWDHMSDLGISERGQRALNARMGVMSPQATPYDEIRRGFAANHLINQGRLDDFVRYGNWSEADRLPGSGFPADLMDMPGHAMHGTHVPNLLEYESAGRLWPSPKTNKVNSYVAASDPVLPLYDMPVADSHFTRMTGLPDVRSATTTGVIRGNTRNPEYGMLAPWWNEKVAAAVDEYPRDAQALAWGLFGPSTGVRQIGKPKLEIISDVIADIAQRHNLPLREARDQLLTGERGFESGGSVDDDFALYGSQYYADGGLVADDYTKYGTMYY